MRQRGVLSDSIPVTDLNSVTVPGAAAAWYDAVEQFGSGKVTFAEVMAPAIRLAEEGWVSFLPKYLKTGLKRNFQRSSIRITQLRGQSQTHTVFPGFLTPGQWQRSETLIKHASPNGDAMLLNGKAPLPGQIMKFPDIAKTFRRLVEKGKPGFYTGPTAEAIVELIRSKGGCMELDDLANHETDFVKPIKYTYADEVTIYEVCFHQTCRITRYNLFK